MRFPPRWISPRTLALAIVLLAARQPVLAGADSPFAGSEGPLSHAATFTTIFRSPLALEGLIADGHGNLFVAHPLLEGADGIVLDRAGNAWLTANERNAVLLVRPSRQVIEVFRNTPDAASRLRNEGPLEFPTSPVLAGRRLCVAHFDVGRRDNAPNGAGEVGPDGPDRAKISCLDQRLSVPGQSEPAP